MKSWNEIAEINEVKEAEKKKCKNIWAQMIETSVNVFLLSRISFFLQRHQRYPSTTISGLVRFLDL